MGTRTFGCQNAGRLLPWTLGMMAVAMLPETAEAQYNAAFPLRTYPTPPYQTPGAREYNIKWRDLTLAISAQLQAEFSDNINLSDNNKKADAFFAPAVNFGFLWSITKDQIMNFDVRVGYRVYVDNSELNTLDISPDSSWDYTFYIEDLRFRVADRFGVELDATSDPQFDYQARDQQKGNQLLEFRRFANTASMDVTYQPMRPFSTTAGYSYYLNRSISGTLERLDRDDHDFHGNMTYDFSTQWTAGVHGNYTIVDFVRKNINRAQNDGRIWTAGPLVTYRPTQELTLSGSGGYTVADYDSSGGIQDREDFEGFTFQVGAQHQITRYTSHDLRAGRSADVGINSNFADVWRVQYGLNTQLTRVVNLNGILGYDYLTASGIGGETANRYLAYLGTTLQITRHLSTQLGYTFALKDSDLPDRDYIQNRVLAILAYKF